MLDFGKEPMTVKRVSVPSHDALTMLVPPFIEQHTDKGTIALAKGMLRVTKEARVLAGQFDLYTEMTRSRPFTEAIANSGAQNGVNIVVGSLLRTMVVSVAALYDKDSRTNNLPKLIKKANEPAVVAHLLKFHAHYDRSSEAEASRRRLVSYQRKLKSGWVKEAAERLAHVRMTHVAHFEADPPPRSDAEKAVIRDLDRVVLATGLIVAQANVFVLGRWIILPELLRTMRRQSGDFCDALIAGSGVGR